MNIENHPCFNPNACKSHGRVHLPIAPRCNIQCNFCNRKFDCVNESRPGVCSSILTPSQAMIYLDQVMERKKNISVMGIAGPGDPFANPDETLTTLDLVKQKYPELLLCVATNGLNLPDYLDDLTRYNVSHVSITINAVDPKIGEKIYAWVRYGKKSLPPAKGAEILLEKQLKSVAGLKERGIIVKVNTIVLPGINDHHVVDIAKKMAEFNVDLLNCMPYYPNEGSNFSHLQEPSKQEITAIQTEAKAYIPQMLHCKRCRADAVGNLDDKPDMVLMESLKTCASIKENPFEIIVSTPSCNDTSSAVNILDKTPEMEMAGESLLLSEKSKDRSADAFSNTDAPIIDDKINKENSANRVNISTSPSYVAVASREGVLVNQHLGEADALYIYDMTHKAPLLVDQRKLPEPGGMDFRWHSVADIIKDCHLVLVSGIGESPKRVLEERGLKVLSVNGLIHELLNAVKQGQAINHLIKRAPSRCQVECTGTGMGCM